MSRKHRVVVRRIPIMPQDLIGAPELAALDMLAHCVHVACLAIIAQYPHLLGDESGRVLHHGHKVAKLAEQLIHRAGSLENIVASYRLAIADAHRSRDEDLLF
jgi:hypothetical protein